MANRVLRLRLRFWFGLAVCGAACSSSTNGSVPESAVGPLADAPWPYAMPEAAGVQSAALEALGQRVRAWVAEESIIGGELLVVKDRSIIFHQAYGWSDRERGIPLERNSIFRIRSMTKPFVGTAVLMLMEQGEVALSDRVADHVPSFDNARSGAITIEQLLTHNTGFRQEGYPEGYWERGNLRDAVDVVGAMGPPDAPGSGYRYSDLNTATLGAIVQERTGMVVEAYLASAIFRPVGLDDTHAFFEPSVPWASRMNSTYRYGDGGWVKYWDNTMAQTIPFFRASGGLYATVLDYAKWLGVFMDRGAYDGGRLLTDPTVVAALTPRASPAYGYHWQIFETASDAGDLPAFGHGGSDGTLAVAIPRQNALVLYFTQSRGTGTSQEMLAMVLQVFEP